MNGETIQLLRRWHDGDRSALDRLIERNLPWVEEHVKRRLGEAMRRAGDTQDFVQHAMIEVLQYGPRFEMADEEQFRRLVARIIENSIRGQHRFLHRERRDIRRVRQLGSDTILSLDPPQRDVTRPSQYVERNEKVAWVRLALELLAPNDREVIWLHEFEKLTFPDIGEQLGLAEDAARMRFKRALPRLAQKVLELQNGQLGKLLQQDEDSAPA